MMGFPGQEPLTIEMFNLDKNSRDKYVPWMSMPTHVADARGEEDLGCLVFGLGVRGSGLGHGASHRSLPSHHFQLWREAQQPRIAPGREAGSPRGKPMAQGGRFCLEHVAL